MLILGIEIMQSKSWTVIKMYYVESNYKYFKQLLYFTLET